MDNVFSHCDCLGSYGQIIRCSRRRMKTCRWRHAAVATGTTICFLILLALHSQHEPVSSLVRARAENLTQTCHLPPPEGAYVVAAWRESKHLKGYQHLSENPALVSHLLVDDVHKTLYCYVPKVACTNWKRLTLILSSLTNQSDPTKIPPDSVHRENVLDTLADFKPNEIIHRLQTYTKFIIVREPMERILSAFRNKFEKNYASSAYFKARFGVKIQRKFRKRKDVSPTGNGTQFSEFVRFLLETRKKRQKFNEHWAPTVGICQPCLVRYDMVGKYETLQRDSSAILRQIGAPPKLRLPKRKGANTRSFLPQYMQSLDTDTERRIRELYAEDTFLFGY